MHLLYRVVSLLVLIPVATVWLLSVAAHNSTKVSLEPSKLCTIKQEPFRLMISGFCHWHIAAAEPEACMDGDIVNNWEYLFVRAKVEMPEEWLKLSKSGCITKQSQEALMQALGSKI